MTNKHVVESRAPFLGLLGFRTGDCKASQESDAKLIGVRPGDVFGHIAEILTGCLHGTPTFQPQGGDGPGALVFITLWMTLNALRNFVAQKWLGLLLWTRLIRCIRRGDFGMNYSPDRAGVSGNCEAVSAARYNVASPYAVPPHNGGWKAVYWDQGGATAGAHAAAPPSGFFGAAFHGRQIR